MAKDNPAVFGYVYLIRNKINGKIYIGKTTQSVRARWQQHYCLTKNRTKSALRNAIKKYGRDNFDVVELGRALSDAELSEMERRAIFTHEATDRRYGYNLTEGGDGVCGYQFSEETRLKISLASKANWANPEWREKTLNKRQEVCTTPEHRQRQRIATLKHCHRPEYKAMHRANTSALWKTEEYKESWREGTRLSYTIDRRETQRKNINRRRETEANFEERRLSGLKAMWSDPVRRATVLAKRKRTTELKKLNNPST